MAFFVIAFLVITARNARRKGFGKNSVRQGAPEAGGNVAGELNPVEGKYRTLIETTGTGYVILDSAGKVREANQEYLRLTGRKTLAEIVNKSVIEWTAEKDRGRNAAAVQTCLEEGYVRDFQIDYVDPQGKVTSIELNATVLGKGRDAQILTLCRDITKHGRIESALRESEERFRSLFESMFNGFAYCRMLYENGRPVDFVYLDVNKAFEKLTGLKGVTGKKVSEVIPGIRDAAPELFEIYGKVAATRESAQFEQYVAPLDLWFSISAYSPAVGYFVAIFDVITERKRAEAQKEATLTALRQSEEHFRTLVETTPSAIFIQKRGRFAYLNQAAVRLFGLSSPDQLDGLPVLERIHPQFHAQIRERIRLLTEERKPAPPLEQVYLRMDGTPVDVEVSAAPFLYQGEPGGLVFAHDITERKNVEKKIKASEERFRELIASVTDYIYTVKIANGRVVSTVHGPGCVTVTGYSSEDYARDPHLWYRMVHDDDKMSIQELSEKLLSGREVLPLEHRIIHKKGLVRWVRHTPVLRRDANGALAGYDGLIADITPRKMAEEALRESEEKLRLLFETSPLGMAMCEMNGDFVQANQAYLDILGYTHEEALKLSYWDVTPKEYAREEEKQLRAMAETGRYGPYEKEYIHKTGERINVLLNGMVVVGADGVGRIWSLVEDITEKKKREENLRLAQQRQALHVQQTPLAVIEFDVNGQVREWNPAAEGMFGFSREEAIGQHWTFIVPQDVRDRLDGVWELLMASRGGSRSTNQNQTKDGQIISCEWFNSALIAPNGKTIGVASLVMDITERKRTENKLRSALREKEILLQELNHRVNNNLQLVSSLLRLQRKHVIDKKVMAVLDESQNRIRAIALIHEMLYLRSGMSSINIRAYVTELTESVVHTYAVGQERISLKLDVENVALNIEQALTCGLVINELLSNALKYAFPAPQKGEISISLHRKGEGEVELLIEDNGVGISKDVDLKSTPTLGVQLVHALVEKQLEGTIVLNTDKGTVYTVRFKEAKENPGEAAEETSW